MGAVMATIEIDQHTAEMLRAKAEARGLSLDDYLRLLAEVDAPNIDAANPRVTLNGAASLAGPVIGKIEGAQLFTAPDTPEIDRILDELAQGGESLSPLPVSFSRKDIYFDHD